MLSTIILGLAFGALFGPLYLVPEFSVRSLLASMAAGATYFAVFGGTTIFRARLAILAMLFCAGVLAGIVYGLVARVTVPIWIPALWGGAIGVGAGPLVVSRRDVAFRPL